MSDPGKVRDLKAQNWDLLQQQKIVEQTILRNMQEIEQLESTPEPDKPEETA